MTTSQVLGLLLLDGDGNRLAVQYGPTEGDPAVAQYMGTYARQRAFEQLLSEKAGKVRASNDSIEVMLVDGFPVLSKSTGDVQFFVVGDPEENELLLAELMQAFVSAITYCTNDQLSKQRVLEQLGTVFVILDELIEQRLVFEVDPTVIAGRVQMTERVVAAAANPNEATTHQSTFNQALNSVKENLFKSFLSSL